MENGAALGWLVDYAARHIRELSQRTPAMQIDATTGRDGVPVMAKSRGVFLGGSRLVYGVGLCSLTAPLCSKSSARSSRHGMEMPRKYWAAYLPLKPVLPRAPSESLISSYFYLVFIVRAFHALLPSANLRIIPPKIYFFLYLHRSARPHQVGTQTGESSTLSLVTFRQLGEHKLA